MYTYTYFLKNYQKNSYGFYLMGRVGRMGLVGLVGWSRKKAFMFLLTFGVYRFCICILIYELKIVTNTLMGFKISCQVGGRDQKF